MSARKVEMSLANVSICNSQETFTTRRIISFIRAFNPHVSSENQLGAGKVKNIFAQEKYDARGKVAIWGFEDVQDRTFVY